MKIDRHSHHTGEAPVKLGISGPAQPATRVICRRMVWCMAFLFWGIAHPDPPPAPAADTSAATPQPAAPPAVSQPRATGLLRQVIWQLAHGPAFIAKVRETVWATGRKVVGVGTYEQSGEGSGRFNLQITMHDGDGRHHFQQISDGKLAWTRSEVSGHVALRRVDVGRLDEWVRPSNTPGEVAPRLRIGAWTEMLDLVDRDYIVRVDSATLQDNPVWVITGSLREQVRARILKESGRSTWPTLCPTKVRIAIAASPDAATGSGELLPTRIEFWSDPILADPQAESSAVPEGRLITLIEIYSIRAITAPPIERFRFDNQDAEVNFVNETEGYIERFGVELTASQRRALQR
jgi:hypothetical protein